MPMTSREMISFLKKNGSHIKLKSKRKGRQTIVPNHGKELKKGLEQAILKQAGLK